MLQILGRSISSFTHEIYLYLYGKEVDWALLCLLMIASVKQWLQKRLK